MRIRYWVGLVLLGTFLVLLMGGPVYAEPPVPIPEASVRLPGAPPFGVPKVTDQGADGATMSPVGRRINVAITSEDEKDPAVALCAYDQYLVVYERGGNIYGQRLTSDGALLGAPFAIYDGSLKAYSPDVACEWAHNRFIVVWTVDYNNQGVDYDIYARGVYGGHQTSGSQLHGSMFVVSEDVAVEQNPAIACNSNDYTCLVVFEYDGTGNGDIYGQRISVGTWDNSLDGDRFNISDFTAEEYEPDVAWGGFDNNYLVVWQYWHDTPSDHYRIVYSHVFDTEQGNGAEERQHVGTWLINVGTRDHSQTNPAVAYNRDTRQYLVAFQYDYYGDGSDYDIIADRVAGTGTTGIGSNFFVASTSSHESEPAAAFSGGPESLPGGMGADQFIVTYLTDWDTLYGQAVKGSYSTSGGQLEGDPTNLDRTGGVGGWYINAADVAGSINNGRYMVVWQYHTSDNDIFGQIVAPYGVYLPLVLRNH